MSLGVRANRLDRRSYSWNCDAAKVVGLIVREEAGPKHSEKMRRISPATKFAIEHRNFQEKQTNG
jgi:hypothetical protein